MATASLTSTRQDPPTANQRITADNFSIVYFGNDWFAENRTSSHHIARLLGEKVPLLYVESPGMRAPSATKRDLKKLGRKLLNAFKRPRPVGDHMWIVTMPQIPFRRFPMVRRLNEFYGRFVIGRAIHRLGMRNVISWFVVPHPGPLAGHLGENYTVYYCIDDYSGLPDVDRDEIRRLDDDLTRVSDQVFVASRTLLDRKRALNTSTRYSPHGVDFDHFSQASNPSLPVPAGANNLSHPVIGFFGSISGWIDLELIADLARARPSWTFLLIGMASVDIHRLQQFDNIVLTGTQSYASLPDWARAFDVAILPYLRHHPGAINANPLKLREYLATGKPIVAVSTPEIDRFSHCIRIANSAGEFLLQIEDALANDTQSDARRRMQEVMTSTWEARVTTVIEAVRRGIAAKSSA